MDTKMYCAIKNQIRKLARENGESENNINIKLTLVNGTNSQAQFNDYNLHENFVSIWTGEEYCFIPIKNILTISC